MSKSKNDKLEEFYKAGKITRPTANDYRQVKVVIKKTEIDNDLPNVLALVMNYALAQLKTNITVSLNENEDSIDVIVEK